MASPLAPERVRVLSMTWEADGVLSLVLVDPEGGPADERRWQVAVLREPAGRGKGGDVERRN
jgi:hypothetical protein